ncbi:MAG: YtxH domain-containing protein [Desulfitobacteriaceae bacterium]
MAEEAKESHLSTVIVAALIGGIAGAVTGLMLAPKSGRELRQEVGLKAQAAWQEVEEVATQGQKSAQAVSTDLLEKGKQLTDDLITFVQELTKAKMPPTRVATPGTSKDRETAPESDQELVHE